MLSCGALTGHFDFKHGRPLLSRNKQVIIPDVVRYTVEHRFVIDPLLSRKQPSKVDPRDHLPVLRRYTRNPIGVPDVSVDIALDIFEFVELVNKFLSVPDDNVMSLIKGVRAAKAKDCGAVAGDKFVCGASHTPAFAIVVKLPHEDTRWHPRDYLCRGSGQHFQPH